MVVDKQIVTSPTDKVTISSFREIIDNLLSYRIVIISDKTGRIIREFKEIANVKLTKDGKIARGKPLEFRNIVCNLKDNSDELVEKGTYIIQEEFEFVDNVLRKSFSTEIRMEY
ncbi:MAG: hypothetical protein N2712_04595 [Brevinematales bacterium]|nr:hypothetical protein [Brevinematales bacterium]